MFDLISMALLSAAGSDMTHDVTVQAAGASVRAAYTAYVDVRMQQRGMSPGTRPGTAQCHWQAFATVTRSVADDTAPTRSFAPVEVGSGFRAGGCMETREGVQADAAASHRRRIGEVLIETARRDEATLTAEIAGTGRLAAGN
ncbi:hypothetical protein ABC347_14770 [Sphingomonas sp. 1P06PA]|uniref:hypothetical protein n=1 Tax=Sphingomonas sp. 1P06PA TaxID=554121 RepID=UPI0039A557C5